MKFTCDDCGAQYMIADEKVGPRGVKVRCKKCSHVIILRPEKEPAMAMSGAGNGAHPSTPPTMSNPPPPPPSDDDEVTGEQMELGPDTALSSEFAAAGFDSGMDSFDDPNAESESETENLPDVESDLASAAAADDALGAGLSSDDEGTDGFSLGSYAGLDESRAQDEDDNGDPTKVEHLDDEFRASLEEDPLSQEEDDEPSEEQTRVEGVEGFGFDSGDDDDLGDEDRAADEGPSGWDDDPLSAAGGSMDEDRDLEDESSDEDGAGSYDFGSNGSYKDEEKRTSYSPPSSPPSYGGSVGLDGLSAGGELAATSGQEAEMATAVASMDRGHFEDEIGNALDAVFGEDTRAERTPSSAGGDAFGALMAEAGPHQQTEDSADPTRVFENEDMDRVEQERELARVTEARSTKESVREWYVAINEEQVGPLNYEEVQSHWVAGDLDPNSLCWKAGMDDWIAIRFVNEFEPIVNAEPEEEEAVPPPAEAASLGALAHGASYADEPEDSPFASASSGGSLFGADSDEDEEADGDEESSWKPSAASALASLAQAALDETSAKPSAAMADIAAGPALPSSPSDSAIDNLMSEPKPHSASMFGAGNQTRVSIAPLPKAPELQSSMPLRDVTGFSPVKRMPIWIPIVAGVAVLGLIGVFAMGGGKDEPKGPTKQEQELAMLKQQLEDQKHQKELQDAKEQAKLEALRELEAKQKAESEQKKETKTDEATDEGEDEADATSSKKKGSKKKGSKRRRKPRSRAKVEDTPPPAPKRALTTEEALLAGAGRPQADPGLPRTLPEDEIFGVLRRNKKDIKRCIDSHKGAGGVLTVKLIIKGNGRTTGVRGSPTNLGSSVGGKCITAAVKRWRFGKFSGPNIPLDFPVRLPNK